MGRLLSKAQTWDDRVEAAKASWIAKGPTPAPQAPTRLPSLPRAPRKVALLVIGVVVALFLLPTAGWVGFGLWTLPLYVVALAYWGVLAYLAYLVIRTAVEHGVRRALQREAISRLDARVDV